VAGGEMWTFPIPDVFQLSLGQVLHADRSLSFQPPRASDVVIVDLNYRTGRMWVEPVGLSPEAGE
jgi:hypothetical protein